MFTKPSLVLQVSRTAIDVLLPTSKSSKSIEQSTHYVWTDKTLDEAISQILIDHPATTVRIILENDLCYMFRAGTEVNRDSIRDLAQTRIPEEFKDHEIRVTESPQTKEHLVTVPVLSFWRAFLKSLNKHKVTVEVYCSIDEALEHAESPYEGISSLKSEAVQIEANIIEANIIEDKTIQADGLIELPKKVSTNKSKKSMIVLSIFAVCISLVILVIFLFPRATPSPQVTTPVATPTITPTPTLQTPDTETLRVEVLNATGRPGVAGTVASLLSRGGFTTIDTGNGTVSDRGANTIAIREATQAASLIPLIQDILKDYEFDQIGIPLEDDNYHLQVIIGR